MTGPVQEKETITNVSAIKKIPATLCIPALVSACVDQLDGSVISNAPKKEIPKMKNSAKNTRLAIQLVAKLFNAAGPKISDTRKPTNVKITMMDSEYIKAFLIPWLRVLLRLVKKLTVTGIMEKMQGVNKATRPLPNAEKKITHKECLILVAVAGADTATLFVDG